MTDLSPSDRDHLEREYDRLAGELVGLFNTIVSTERLALGGAAGIAAFLYSDFAALPEGQITVIAALPLAIIVLAGLRCLSIFVAMITANSYLRDIEPLLLSLPNLGLQRRHYIDRSRTLWFIIASTTTFWLVATAVAAFFWLTFDAPATE